MTEQEKTLKNTPEKTVTKAPEKASPATKAKAKTPVNSRAKPKQSISKTAVFAIFLSTISLVGIAGHYYWQEQLHNKQSLENNAGIEKLKSTISNQVNLALNNGQASTNNLVNSQLEAFTKQQQQQWLAIDAKMTELSQVKPVDWLAQEAAYMIRVAVRSLWLEKNSNTAIQLLKDADNKLAEMSNPEYLSVRSAIRDDISSLQAIPTLNTDSVILSLMTLNHQVDKLPLAYVDRKEEVVEEKALTGDIADWRENLAKSWQNFVDQYFTLRPINANIKPLLSPQYQQHLRHNLALKLQQAQWAAGQQKETIYQATLADIEKWINDYFDTEQLVSQNFIAELSKLKQAQITFAFNGNLTSLQQIKALLVSKPLSELPEPSQQEVETKEGEVEEAQAISEDKSTKEKA